jgi:uncharacterized repeat protein (TIGR01451 family)
MGVLANPSGVAQTPAGTKIRNEARASFLYRTGQSDSVRSNVTETVALQPLVVASSLNLVATPQALLGNGQDTSWLNATVLDAGGNTVPDGTPVFFTTSRGSFPGRTDSATALTRNGIASVVLCSDVVPYELQTAEITATTPGFNKSPLVASVRVLFYPGALQGIVISALDGHRVQGAVAIIHDASNGEVGRDTTTAAGTYIIPVKGSGLFTRTISYVNHFGDQIRTTASFTVQVPVAGGIPSATILNAIAGAVVDRSTGLPIRQSGITVSINRLGASKTNAGRMLPATLTTDARGTFVFDSLTPGPYQIRVLHPQYAGSLVIEDTLPNSFTVEANISAAENAAFELVKIANKRIAEIGDAIAYSIDLRNTSVTSPITNIRLFDDLPVGFVYASQSSRLDRKVLGEPTGSRRLIWTLSDTLQAGKSMRLSYTVTIGAGALDGQGINRANGVGQDLAGDTVRSGESSVQVLVHPGVFTDRGVVIGKVFFDRNGNGIQEEGELGIAGVELWMEDGTHIVTGDDGKYSLPEVKPGQHVIRVDRRTLPAGSELLAIGTEFAGDGSSRFIRLVEGGIVRADFHVAPPRQASLEVKLVHGSTAAGYNGLMGRYTIRWNEKVSAPSIALVDTLTRGFHYDLRSVVASDSCTTGGAGDSRTLCLYLRPMLNHSIDSVQVAIRADSALRQGSVALRPRLVLSYPKRRDAVIETGRMAETVQTSSTVSQEAGKGLVDPEGEGAGTFKQNVEMGTTLPLLQPASSRKAASPEVNLQQVVEAPAMKADSGCVVSSHPLSMNQPRSSSIVPEAPSPLRGGKRIGLTGGTAGVTGTIRGTQTNAGSGGLSPKSMDPGIQGKKDSALTQAMPRAASRESERDLSRLEADSPGIVKQEVGTVLPSLQTAPPSQATPPVINVQQVAAALEVKADSGVVAPSRSLPMNQLQSSPIPPDAPSASQPPDRIGLAEDEVAVTDTDPGTPLIQGYGKFASLSVTSANPGKKTPVSTRAKVEKPLSMVSGEDSGARESGRIQVAEVGDVMLSTLGLTCFVLVVRRISCRMKSQHGQRG